MTTQRPDAMSRLGLGGYPLGGGYGRVDIAQARATVDAALEHGITYIDTAETYLDSEERLGAILAGRRDRVFLATKAFPCEPYAYENLAMALDSSLKRLQTDRIDLYQLHGPENWLADLEDLTPLEELADSLGRLRASGKALQIGVCNLPLDELQTIAQHTDLFSTQNLYSILDRGDDPDFLHLPVESQLIPWTRVAGIAFIAYSPLSRGLLAGNQDPQRRFGPDDERHYLPRYQPGVYEHYVALADRLHAWAQERDHSLEELAVAWTLANPGVTATLIGAKSPAQVAAIAGAAAWDLTPGDLGEIDAIVGQLPEVARDAKMVVWDHFDPSIVEGLRTRRWEGLGASA